MRGRSAGALPVSEHWPGRHGPRDGDQPCQSRIRIARLKPHRREGAASVGAAGNSFAGLRFNYIGSIASMGPRSDNRSCAEGHQQWSILHESCVKWSVVTRRVLQYQRVVPSG